MIRYSSAALIGIGTDCSDEGQRTHEWFSQNGWNGFIGRIYGAAECVMIESSSTGKRRGTGQAQ